MSDDGSFLGLDFKLIVAGAAGGVSILYSMTKPDSWELIAGLVVGGMVANYVTPLVVPDVSRSWALLVAFFIGTIGKWLCLQGFKFAKSRFAFLKER